MDKPQNTGVFLKRGWKKEDKGRKFKKLLEMERDSIILLWFSDSISTEVEAFKIYFPFHVPPLHIH